METGHPSTRVVDIGLKPKSAGPRTRSQVTNAHKVTVHMT